MSGCKYDSTSGLQRFISLTEMLGDVTLWTFAPVLNTCVCPVQYLTTDRVGQTLTEETAVSQG